MGQPIIYTKARPAVVEDGTHSIANHLRRRVCHKVWNLRGRISKVGEEWS